MEQQTKCECSSVGRASRCQRDCRRFDSGHSLHFRIAASASVAQLVEHHVANVIVAGSIPVTRSIFQIAVSASVAQLVEHHVANVIVAGSIPVTRSIFLSGYLSCQQKTFVHYDKADRYRP